MTIIMERKAQPLAGNSSFDVEFGPFSPGREHRLLLDVRRSDSVAAVRVLISSAILYYPTPSTVDKDEAWYTSQEQLMLPGPGLSPTTGQKAFTFSSYSPPLVFPVVPRQAGRRFWLALEFVPQSSLTIEGIAYVESFDRMGNP